MSASPFPFHEQMSCQENGMLPLDGTQQPQCALALRLGKSVGFLAVGVATGMGVFSVTQQGRFRLPVQPLARGSLNRLTKLPAELPKFPVAFPIPPNNECGAAICAEGDLCCPGGPGYGYSCGTTNAVCCQGFLENDDGSPSQVSVAIVCGENDVCCRNDDSNPYCCASGNQCVNNVCVAAAGQCFTGASTVLVRGRGPTPLASLSSEDEILVPDGFGSSRYEPLLQFLHRDETTTSSSSYLSVLHEHGQLWASDSHIVFTTDASGLKKDVPVSQLASGDDLHLAGSEVGDVRARGSRVLAVRRSHDASGMYAPLTASGQVIVDGVVASCYARPFSRLQVTHGAIHAAMFVVRGFTSPVATGFLRDFFRGRAELDLLLPAMATFLFSAK
eukprot:TRINITY_DN3067_c0_g4_i1.p1 TRINITY_DN3067_c0_g4~~TRINITY_DN3067_c0_g4_i1.p1  ORF type:complete len:389 (-),score=23.71 TRINITY_DN3067_c0_g4_i1:220-1386(-)